MLGARSAIGRDGGGGGGEPLKEPSERGTAPRNAVVRLIGGFPTAAGKQSRADTERAAAAAVEETEGSGAARDNNDAEMHSRN